MSEWWLILQNYMRVKRVGEDKVGDRTLENFSIYISNRRGGNKHFKKMLFEAIRDIGKAW